MKQQQKSQSAYRTWKEKRTEACIKLQKRIELRSAFTRKIMLSAMCTHVLNENAGVQLIYNKH